MITYTTANTADFSGILALQRINLPKALTEVEIKSQGFVTLQHSLELLQRMNQIESHIIAKDQDKVIAYILAMTNRSRADIPVLSSLFEQLEQLQYQGASIASYHYLIVGQACVDKAYRGQGVFDDCYSYYQEVYAPKYDFAITAISTKNPRSLRAHQRVGFQQVHSFLDADQKEWWVVLWDWR